MSSMQGILSSSLFWLSSHTATPTSVPPLKRRHFDKEASHQPSTDFSALAHAKDLQSSLDGNTGTAKGFRVFAKYPVASSFPLSPRSLSETPQDSRKYIQYRTC